MSDSEVGWSFALGHMRWKAKVDPRDPVQFYFSNEFNQLRNQEDGKDGRNIITIDFNKKNMWSS